MRLANLLALATLGFAAASQDVSSNKFATGYSNDGAPSIKFATGYSNGIYEAHPHAGVELASGGFFLVGDSMITGDGAVSRQQFAVKSEVDGTEIWQTAIGDLGYNYGKFGLELSDKTLLVFGSSSVSSSSSSSSSYTELRSIHRLDPDSGEVLSHTLLPSSGSGQDGFMGADLVSADEDGLTVWATGYLGGEGTPSDEEAMFLIDGGSAFAMMIRFPREGTGDASVVWEKIFDDTEAFKMEQGMRIVDTKDSSGTAMLISTALPEDGGLKQWSALSLSSTGEVAWRRLLSAGNGTMSHPYALTADGAGGAVAAGHLYPASPSIISEVGLPVGRMLRFSSSGTVVWDVTFKPDDGLSDHNVECYGVAPTLDGGYVATCGYGCMPETCKRVGVGKENKIWQVLAHRVNANGEKVWETLYTDTSKGNNAGEYIVGLKDGGYAIYVDATSWGSQDTGGNFGLIVLDSDTKD